MTEIEKFANDNVNRLLVGNKSDLEEKREVTYDEGEELAKQYDVPFLEVSAKNSTNIEETFTTMATDIQTRFWKMKEEKKKGGVGVSQRETKPLKIEKETNRFEDPAKKKSNCCQ